MLIQLDFPSVNNYIQMAMDVLQGNWAKLVFIK
jgi:hypothetical protein